MFNSKELSMRFMSQSVMAIAMGLALPAYGETAPAPPDAGRILQEQQAPRLVPPKPSQVIDFSLPEGSQTLPGGAQIVIQSIRFKGHTVLTESALLDVLIDVPGQSLDLAGLRGLADRISRFYRESGFPFARAYLPPQSLDDGLLVIEVVEGRYGGIQAIGEPDLLKRAQRFLTRLKPGSVIESKDLERATLILADQPGIRAAPIIRPGQELGTGDLDVEVSRVPGLSGDVGVDNHGSRASGDQRVKLNAQADSPFGFGDQLTLRSMVSQHSTWLGSLGYSLPLGASGVRASMGYAHTGYYIGEGGSERRQDASKIGIWGTAIVSTAGLSYPVLRSQKANLTLGAMLQRKALYNNNDGQTVSDYSSQSTNLSAQFDVRDSLMGGGITYGTVSFTPGRMHLDAEQLKNDKDARVNGDFAKTNVDIARLQSLPVSGLSAFARLSAQNASKNLDSSEGFGLGGASGVRAYPSSEGYGNEGWLAQLEIRYALGAFAPYVFHDAGSVLINKNPWDAQAKNSRALSGSGLGLRYAHGLLSVDANIAWRGQGGISQSDKLQLDPRAWVSASYRF